MATNDFLPFGGDGAANVITQAEYAALLARLTGFQSGVAHSDELNKVWRQASIMAAVLAQFIADRSLQDVVDDGSTATILSNLKAVLPVNAAPQGQLSYNAGNLLLSPYRGNKVFIPGQGIATIPNGGVSYTPAALTTNTLYYVYATLVSGSLVLQLSTTGHTTDATGVEVMTGDNTKALVGMAYALGATSIEATVRSWANDPGYATVKNLTSNSSTTSTTPTNINTSLITPFLLWAKEIPTISVISGVSVSTANFSAGTTIAVDNAVLPGGIATVTPPAAGASYSSALTQFAVGLAEGRHTANLFGNVVESVTGTWSGSAGTSSQTSLSFSIPRTTEEIAMTKKAIGPTFPAELEVAGLMGLPFSWSEEGDIFYSDAITDAQMAAIEAVYDKHDPTALLNP